MEWLTDRDGDDVIGIPVTLKNIGDETGKLSSASYKFFGPDGTEVDGARGLRDYDIWSQGDMRPQATQDGYFVIEYAGDGEYVIEFSESRQETKEVIFRIEK